MKKTNSPIITPDFDYRNRKKNETDTQEEEIYRKHYYKALDLMVDCIRYLFEQIDYRIYVRSQELMAKNYYFFISF